MKWGRRIDRVAGALGREQARQAAGIAAQRERVIANLRMTQVDFDLEEDHASHRDVLGCNPVLSVTVKA